MGNDIVDLRSLEAAGKGADLPFVARVLTAAEEEALDRSGRRDLLLWLIWAAKETAYKAVSKGEGGLSFIPRRFQMDPTGIPADLSSLGNWQGLVRTPGGEVHVKAEATDDYVHVVGCTSDEALRRVTAFCAKPGGDESELPRAEESRLVRGTAIEALAPYLGAVPEDLEIRRSPCAKGLGPPLLYHKGKPAAVDLSLSHHGRFVAVAFLAID
ncbi:MAG: 4'-phosphopantetheinyl transferase superfamily protein [Smithellaceae bacterium]|nr:4'-phosphopantetheinyl transferase superfamily protein [Smithellaceae bacterium]